MQEQGLSTRIAELQQELAALGQIPTLWYSGIQYGYECFKQQSYDERVMQYNLKNEESMARLKECLKKYDKLSWFFKLFYSLFNRKYEHFRTLIYYQKYSSAKTNRELKSIANKYNPANLSYFSTIKNHLIALRENALQLPDTDQYLENTIIANNQMSGFSTMIQMALKDQIALVRIEYEELFKQQKHNAQDEAEAVIKSYYRKNIIKYHPDKNLQALEEAKEAFIILTEDYQFYCKLIITGLYSSYESRAQIQDLVSEYDCSEATKERLAKRHEESLRERKEWLAEFKFRQEARFQQECEWYKSEQEKFELRRIQDLQESERKRQDLEQKMKESEQKMHRDLQELEKKRIQDQQESEQRMRAEFLGLLKISLTGGHIAPMAAPVIAPASEPVPDIVAVSITTTSNTSLSPTVAPTFFGPK